MMNKILLIIFLSLVSLQASAQATYIINDNPVKGKAIHPQECLYTTSNVSARWFVWPWPFGVDRISLKVDISHKEGSEKSKVCEVSPGDTIIVPEGCYRMSYAELSCVDTENGYTYERYTALMSRKLHWFAFIGTYGQEVKESTSRFYSIGEDCKYIMPKVNPGHYIIYNENYAYIIYNKPH